jgi:uncharacterized membrane protein YsdA (DUF1294 family)
MKKQLLIYTLIGVGLSVSLATSFQSRLTVHPYVTWIVASSIVAWALYAWDKRTAELGKFLRGWRVPELTLNLMALMGGFPGAWMGRAMFQHKSNTKRHPVILAVLIVSTVVHALVVLRLLYGPPLVLWPPSEWWSF